MKSRFLMALMVWIAFSTTPALAQDDSEDLARQLANPVASLISVPFQFNFDRGIGADDDGKRYAMNIQPVIPFSLSRDWNMISRTIVPVVGQSDISPGADSQFGLGDTVQSIFFFTCRADSEWIDLGCWTGCAVSDRH